MQAAAGLMRVAALDGSASFKVEIVGSFAPVLEGWNAMAGQGAALPFQCAGWLATWEATLGREPGVEILAVTVRDASGAPVLALPLVRRREAGTSVIGFADGGICDYNAPILARAAPADRAGADALWRALRRALPACDIVRLEKMPLRVAGRANPLALLPGARPSPALGLSLDMTQPYADWRQAFPRRHRMELGRCDRLFDALPDAWFGQVARDETRVLDDLERLQRERIATLGHDYVLDAPIVAGFYRRLAAGPGLLTALTANGETVAALLGLRHGAHYVMLRIAAAAGDYTRLSPARVLILRTMEMLRADGVQTFDFGLGDYAYKRKLGGLPVELCDLVAAGSARGLPELALFRGKAVVRGSDRLRALAGWLRPRRIAAAGMTPVLTATNNPSCGTHRRRIAGWPRRG